ncbi:MAG: hypothetical protein EBU81_06855 [Proteobacteria bacterium]|nr:hypothetical protein [Pseudomonadota bacterium]
MRINKVLARPGTPVMSAYLLDQSLSPSGQVFDRGYGDGGLVWGIHWGGGAALEPRTPGTGDGFNRNGSKTTPTQPSRHDAIDPDRS